MNDFTKEELEILDNLKTPVICLEAIQRLLDLRAKSWGYENHDDLLTKTGWKERFVNE